MQSSIPNSTRKRGTMSFKNNICNTCKNKKGKVFKAPISKEKVPIFSCKNYPLSKGYDYDNNKCSNFESEVL